MKEQTTTLTSTSTTSSTTSSTTITNECNNSSANHHDIIQEHPYSPHHISQQGVEAMSMESPNELILLPTTTSFSWWDTPFSTSTQEEAVIFVSSLYADTMPSSTTSRMSSRRGSWEMISNNHTNINYSIGGNNSNDDSNNNSHTSMSFLSMEQTWDLCSNDENIIKNQERPEENREIIQKQEFERNSSTTSTNTMDLLEASDINYFPISADTSIVAGTDSNENNQSDPTSTVGDTYPTRIVHSSIQPSTGSCLCNSDKPRGLQEFITLGQRVVPSSTTPLQRIITAKTNRESTQVDDNDDDSSSFNTATPIQRNNTFQHHHDPLIHLLSLVSTWYDDDDHPWFMKKTTTIQDIMDETKKTNHSSWIIRSEDCYNNEDSWYFVDWSTITMRSKSNSNKLSSGDEKRNIRNMFQRVVVDRYNNSFIQTRNIVQTLLSSSQRYFVTTSRWWWWLCWVFLLLLVLIAVLILVFLLLKNILLVIILPSSTTTSTTTMDEFPSSTSTRINNYIAMTTETINQSIIDQGLSTCPLVSTWQGNGDNMVTITRTRNEGIIRHDKTIFLQSTAFPSNKRKGEGSSDFLSSGTVFDDSIWLTHSSSTETNHSIDGAIRQCRISDVPAIPFENQYSYIDNTCVTEFVLRSCNGEWWLCSAYFDKDSTNPGQISRWQREEDKVDDGNDHTSSDIIATTNEWVSASYDGWMSMMTASVAAEPVNKQMILDRCNDDSISSPFIAKSSKLSEDDVPLSLPITNHPQTFNDNSGQGSLTTLSPKDDRPSSDDGIIRYKKIPGWFRSVIHSPYPVMVSFNG